MKEIRSRGTRRRYGGKEYLSLDVDGFEYWTMGAPVGETILMPHEPRKNTGEINVEVLGPHALTCESIGDKVVDARLGAEKIQRGPVAISSVLALS